MNRRVLEDPPGYDARLILLPGHLPPFPTIEDLGYARRSGDPRLRRRLRWLRLVRGNLLILASPNFVAVVTAHDFPEQLLKLRIGLNLRAIGRTLVGHL